MADYENTEQQSFEAQDQFEERVIEIARVAKVVKAVAASSSVSRLWSAISGAHPWVWARRMPCPMPCAKLQTPTRVCGLSIWPVPPSS